MVEVIIPSQARDFEIEVAAMASTSVMQPFSELAIQFADSISKAVLLDAILRRSPEMAAVAHWMRGGHILRLRDQFETGRGGRIRVGRGVVLHFAPSNVDSIFMYSWFISMLVGNLNIVRLSSNRGTMVDLLLEKINQACDLPQFHEIRKRSLVVAYAHDEEITARLSGLCQMRVIWGGDNTVRQIRSIALNPLASEIAFANRFSLAVLNAPAVVTLTDDALSTLAARFCNDAYSFDQMACSSPRLVGWIGPEAVLVTAKERFWRAVRSEVGKRVIEYPEVVGINKVVASFAAVAAGGADAVAEDMAGAITRVHLPIEAVRNVRQVECGGGMFFEVDGATLEEIGSILTDRDQTLAYFGFEPEQMSAFAATLPTRAVDRVVPIGAALNFDATWDGYDLLHAFTREIVVQ